MMNPLRRCRGVGRMLHILQERHHWLCKDARVCFVAGPWQQTLLTWITRQQDVGRRTEGPQRLRKPSKGPRVPFIELHNEDVEKKKFLESIISDPHGTESAVTSFYVFSDLSGHSASRLRVSGTDVTPLPITTAEAASYIRHQSNGSRRIGAIAVPSSFQLEASPLPGISSGMSLSSSDSCALSLNSHSSDLVAMDFTDPHTSEALPECPIVSFNTRQNVLNAMTLSTYLLKPTGAVLLRFPSSIRLGSDRTSLRALLRHMRWGFQGCTSEIDGEHLYCLGYRSAAEHRISGRPTTPFPGFLRKSERRPQKWNPRRGNTRGYFATLMPSFTNAPPVTEPLGGRAFAQTVDATEGAEGKADAFFNLSVEMVASGSYHRKRDD